ncbi:hypothetical protein DM02DRAFT_369249 [Periconia macrospinosa]|uniref:Uncharacterized protein n=1 Tax=Periconia macrospinosa TaxID=97972 RepID=A0A2V1DUT9_9PLEO|nr:hypothetical protein DM02DRAFT_369249 [Periconia macrospinosa]
MFFQVLYPTSARRTKKEKEKKDTYPPVPAAPSAACTIFHIRETHTIKQKSPDQFHPCTYELWERWGSDSAMIHQTIVGVTCVRCWVVGHGLWTIFTLIFYRDWIASKPSIARHLVREPETPRQGYFGVLYLHCTRISRLSCCLGKFQRSMMPAVSDLVTSCF